MELSEGSKTLVRWEGRDEVLISAVAAAWGCQLCRMRHGPCCWIRFLWKSLWCWWMCRLSYMLVHGSTLTSNLAKAMSRVDSQIDCKRGVSCS